MPRIRTIKPEFCTSEQVAECSTTARLLFVCMWCFCDDAGRHPSSAKRLKMECFPGDSFTEGDIQQMIAELIEAGLLVEYAWEGKLYLQVTGWHHQRIEKASYKFGPFDSDGGPAPLDDQSTTARRPLDDSSPPEGNGREGRGKEGKGEDGGVADTSTTPPAATTPKPPVSPQEPLSEFEFPVTGDPSKPTWWLTSAKLDEYREAFPALDIEAEMRAARQYVRDAPARRKTARGMHKFLGDWLRRSQDNPKLRSGASGGSGSLKTFGQQRTENTSSAIKRFAERRSGDER